MAGGNGYDRESWHDLFERVGRIDERTGRQEAMFGAMENDLKQISHNTGTIANFFADLRTDNRELSRIAAGKDKGLQRLFILVIAFIGIYLLGAQIKDSSLNINIPWLGIHLTHTKEDRGK